LGSGGCARDEGDLSKTMLRFFMGVSKAFVIFMRYCESISSESAVPAWGLLLRHSEKEL
jgi:hypothetical protein